MRHLVTVLLPPRTSIEIKIDPPITLDERPYVFTFAGADTVTIHQESSERVTLINTTEKVAPAAFVVTAKDKDPIPGWLRMAARFLKG